MLKAALTALCFLSLLATAYLTLSVIVLRPPRATFAVWSVVAALFGTDSILTVVALAWGLSAVADWLRYVLFAGAVVIAVIGAWWVNATVWGSQFEGYGLVLGSMLVVQSVLTVWILRPRSNAIA